MTLYYFGAISPGTRHITSNVFKKIIYHKFNKQLLRSNVNATRRSGKIVCRHYGGGHKRFCRKIDFWRSEIYEFGHVFVIDYDPNRSSRVALILYEDKIKTHILAPAGVCVGANVIMGF